jgi:putative DNA methylase
MVQVGVLASKGGRVVLLRPDALPAGGNPPQDERLSIWEIAHHPPRALDGGEVRAAGLLPRVRAASPVQADAARDLAHRPYTLCERSKRAGEALAYNVLVVAWQELLRLAGQVPHALAQTRDLL